jgi:hypothetical protein
MSESNTTPADGVTTGTGQSWTLERLDDGEYRMVTSAGVRGYVERVGRVWVALEGPRPDHSVEIGQTLSLESAASLLKPPC